VEGQKVQVVNEIVYLGVKLDSTARGGGGFAGEGKNQDSERFEVIPYEPSINA
jgi:hypothetical protein